MVLSGGNANNGANAGLGYVNAHNVSSNSDRNIGARKCKKHSNDLASIAKKRLPHKVVGRVTEDHEERSRGVMKRYGDLFVKLCSMDNLVLAEHKARKGKENTYGVRQFDKDKDNNLLKLQHNLRQKLFSTSRYETFDVYEPKHRTIYKLPYYPDRIVHHAIMNVIDPIITKTLTHNTYACIKGRGLHACVKKVSKIIRTYEGRPLYCLKIDIRKFYPSIDHDVMKSVIRRKIKDKDLLWLLDDIIDSTDGMPIGNYISQQLANLLLAGVMHRVNEVWKIDAVEYADDMVFFSEDKKRLHYEFHEHIKPYIENELKLQVKSNYQVFPIARNRYDKSGRGLDFCGYVFYSDCGHRLMRKSIKKSLCRAVKKKKYKSVPSLYGWAKHSNSNNLLNKLGINEKSFKHQA